MNKHEVFDAWAPRGSAWSAWAKPVLFTATCNLMIRRCTARLASSRCFVGTRRRYGGGTRHRSPGSAGVWMGLALAAAGYRPVPLYNACPDPTAARWPSPLQLPTMPVQPSTTIIGGRLRLRRVFVRDRFSCRTQAALLVGAVPSIPGRCRSNSVGAASCSTAA